MSVATLMQMAAYGNRMAGYRKRRGRLTDDEVKSLYTVMPSVLIDLIFSDERVDLFREASKRAEKAGAKMYLIGWPDGTMVTHLARDGDGAIDTEALLYDYRVRKTRADLLNEGTHDA